MADSKYSMSEATLDSFGFSTFSVASEPYGLSSFAGAMAQLGAALNEAGLNIRLLTVEQGKLGEVVSSLTAALFAPRSQLTAFSQAPEARDESPFRLNLEVAPRPSLESPRLPMARQADNHTCICELKSPIQVTVEHKIEPQSSQDGASEKYLRAPSTIDGIGLAAQPGAQPGATPSSSVSALEAKLDWLRSIVPSDYSGPIDRLSSYTKEHPQLAGHVYDAGAKAGEVVLDEALANLAQKFLRRLPWGLGKLLGEDDSSLDGPGKVGKESPSSQKKTRDSKGRTRRQRSKASSRNNLKSPQLIKAEVQRRKTSPSMAGMRTLASFDTPAMPRNFSSHTSLTPTLSLSGKAPIAASLASKATAPLRMAEAAIGLTQAIARGDTKAVVSSAGSLVGSSAGAAAGAAIGTMIFPGVGTAIGGMIGGLAGSELGSMLGEKLLGLADRLRAPEQVSKDLTTVAPLNQPINFAPSIQVTCPSADNAEQIRNVIAQQLQAQFHGEFVPLMSHNALATRRDAALTDGGV
ncbi:TPA: hypothetical protein SAN82_000835 [Pseudomonas putida]|nr:hypothetical protein [Pseudomonas putida]